MERGETSSRHRLLLTFTEDGAQVSVWAPEGDAPDSHTAAERASHREDAPAPRVPHAALALAYLHVHDGDGTDVVRELKKLAGVPFALAAIRPACWNDDLTPWTCPGLFADDAPFSGRAREELSLLEQRIVPHVEKELRTWARNAAASARGGDPCGTAVKANHDAACTRLAGSRASCQTQSGGASGTQRAVANAAPGQLHFSRTIAGYSLAGLFATWAAFNSRAFSRIASASGSLWYPDFARYVAERDFARIPECASFSLGSKESKTPSRLLRNVARGTDEVIAAFREKGVPVHFEMNPGNHFKEPAARMARAIAWAISQPAPTR